MWRLTCVRFIEYASEDLKVNEEVKMEADMRKMLEYASEELEADRGVYMSILRRSWCRRRRQTSSDVVFVDMLQRSRRKTKKMFGGHRAGWLYTSMCLTAVLLRVLHFELKADRGVVLEITKPHGDVQEYASEELQADRGTMTEDVNMRGRPREPD